MHSSARTDQRHPARSVSRGLAARLYGAAAIPIIMFIAFSAGLWVSLDRLANRLQQDATEMTALALEAKDMSADVIQVQQFLTDVSATRGQDGLDDGFKLALEHREAFIQGLDKFVQASRVGRVDVPAVVLTGLRTRFDNFYNAGLTMAKAYVRGGPQEGNPMMEPFDKASTDMQADLQPFVKQQTELLVSSIASSLSDVRLMQWLSAVVCAAAALVVGVASWRLARSVVVPVGEVVQAVRRMASGDLRLPFKPAALARSPRSSMRWRSCRSNLAKACLLCRTARAPRMASGEVASGNQDLSQRTERTASNLQRTTGSIEELSATVRPNAQRPCRPKRWRDRATTWRAAAERSWRRSLPPCRTSMAAHVDRRHHWRYRRHRFSDQHLGA